MSAAATLSHRVPVTLTVNGETIHREVEARRHLVDFLRLDLGLTGSHAGCEQGVCGACTLKVDGEIVRGCLTLVAQLDGAEIWTVEGLSETGEIRDLQDEFVQRNALQCGFCTPGMLVTAADILDRPGPHDRESIREHLSGNYCRCTGYETIVDAVSAVIEARHGGREATR